MHVVINAIPIRPGGGLTVLHGLVAGIRTARPSWQLTVLAGDTATHESVLNARLCDSVERIETRGGSAGAFAWQNLRLGNRLQALRADSLLTFNHHIANAAALCPQIVYHLNLRRFSRDFRSPRLNHVIQEGIRDWSAQRALRLADANVFESQFLREAAKQTAGREPHNSSVAYIGLPDALLAEAACLYPGPHSSQSRRIVSITSCEPHKDNDTLIRAMAELIRQAPAEDWRLDIIGGINRMAWAPWEAMADDLGVRQRITWHGFLSQDVISRLLCSALCLASTSRLESFAMVGLEAMARGCPAIVADCAAMRESVGSAGICVTPGDPAAFAAAIRELAVDPQLRAELVQRGIDWIKNFTWSECGRTFAILIECLTQQRLVAKAVA